MKQFFRPAQSDEAFDQSNARSRGGDSAVHLGMLLTTEPHRGSRNCGIECCNRTFPELARQYFTDLPGGRLIPTLSLQANLPKEQPQRHRSIRPGCDYRVGRFVVPTGNCRCPCRLVSIERGIVTKYRTVAIVLGIASMTLLLLAYYSLNGHKTPATQGPLSDLDAQTLDAFKAQFNGAKERIRIILLLSPT